MTTAVERQAEPNVLKVTADYLNGGNGMHKLFKSWALVGSWTNYLSDTFDLALKEISVINGMEIIGKTGFKFMCLSKFHSTAVRLYNNIKEYFFPKEGSKVSLYDITKIALNLLTDLSYVMFLTGMVGIKLAANCIRNVGLMGNGSRVITDLMDLFKAKGEFDKNLKHEKLARSDKQKSLVDIAKNLTLLKISKTIYSIITKIFALYLICSGAPLVGLLVSLLSDSIALAAVVATHYYEKLNTNSLKEYKNSFSQEMIAV